MYTFDSVFLSKYILFKSNEKLQRYNLRTFRVIITPEKMVHSDFHWLVGLLNCKGIDVVRCNIVIPCTIIRHVRWIGGYRLLLLIMRDVTANKHARSRADIATLYSEMMLLGIRYEREKKFLKKRRRVAITFVLWAACLSTFEPTGVHEMATQQYRMRLMIFICEGEPQFQVKSPTRNTLDTKKSCSVKPRNI